MSWNTPVAVVGRGPVGMTTALRLSALGVESTIVDPQPRDSVRPGSKAVLVAQHVADILEPVGVGAQIVHEGVQWPVSRTYFRDRLLQTTEMRTQDGLWPPVQNLPQARVEELLLERVLDDPHITLLPGHTVTALTQDADHVLLRCSGPDGDTDVVADYVAGCDGARSSTRKLLDVTFTGHGHDDHFLISDIVGELPFPTERRFFFDPPFNPGRTVLVHPQPGNSWHIDWQVGAQVDPAEELRSGRLERRLRSIVGLAEFDVVWTTCYRFRQLLADRFRVGRVFLVGDAAHLVSPYGARGMNSGVADAEDLAWRLAFVCRRWAAPQLLDGYEAERYPVAEENLRITGATARFMCPRTRAERVRQRAALWLGSRIPALRRLVDSGRLYQPPTYPVGPGAGTGSPLSPGRLLPDAVIPPGSTDENRLRALTRRGICLLWFVGESPGRGAAALREAVRSLAPPVTAVVVGGRPAAGTTDTGGRWLTVADPSGALARQYCPHGVGPSGLLVVVRPDSYVAGVHDLAEDIDVARVVTDHFDLRATA